MQHIALLPTGISPLTVVTLWVDETQVVLSEDKTRSFLHPGDNFKPPVIAICPHDALWCSLAGYFLVQVLILTSEKVSHPFPSEFPVREPQRKFLCQKCLLVFIY